MSVPENMKLFGGMLAEELHALAQTAEIRTYGAGQNIFQEGEPGNGMFVVIEGLVQVSKLVTDGQRLLYGKGEKKVTGIILQLKHTKDLPIAVNRLNELFAANNQDLEVRDFKKLSPTYGQIISMFVAIFTFLAMIMGIIVLFTIVNTMSMSVMERVNEIGTVRALGIRRSGVMRLFLTEGCLLGVLGATIGALLAAAAAFAINAAGITWTPPNNVEPVFLTVLLFQNPVFLPVTWAGLILLAVISSFIPARKAARMIIVDALRHV